jgi:hypothetical protein
MSDLDNYEVAKQTVVDWMTKKSSKAGGKTKFYANDLAKLFPESKLRDVKKKLLNKLVTDEIIEYWSSGSTTMYGLKGAGIQHSSEGE